MKDEKMKIAIEKMKIASKRKVAIKVFNNDGSNKTVVVEEGMTAAVVCYLLVSKNHFEESPNWTIIERLGDVGLGKDVIIIIIVINIDTIIIIITIMTICTCISNFSLFLTERELEDHECVEEIYTHWARDSNNQFFFRRNDMKYELFVDPIVSDYLYLLIPDVSLSHNDTYSYTNIQLLCSCFALHSHVTGNSSQFKTPFIFSHLIISEHTCTYKLVCDASVCLFT